jgi:hypothetical protein
MDPAKGLLKDPQIKILKKPQQNHMSSPKTSKPLTSQQHTVGILVRFNVLFLIQ